MTAGFKWRLGMVEIWLTFIRVVTVQSFFLLPEKCIVELRLASDVLTNLGAWIPVARTL